MTDEHELGLTDPRIIQILSQTKEGRARLKAWSERDSKPEDPSPLQTNAPALSLRNLINALVFSLVLSSMLTLLMIGAIEVVRWIF